MIRYPILSTSASPMSMSTSTRIENDGNGGKDDKKLVVQSMSGWGAKEAAQESVQLLRRHNVDEPEISVCHLLAEALDLPWETGYKTMMAIVTSNDETNSTRTLSPSQAQSYSQNLRRRAQHEPLQHILGKWDFLDYTIQIRPPLLCPRPETEELVMKVIQDTTESPVHILDVGCGTGVIGIALADQMMDAFIQAIDIDPIAIETSLGNAQSILGEHGQASCYQATLVAAEDYDHPEHTYDVVVSNPPYIPEVDRSTLSKTVVQYESHQALFAGPDGMDVIRTIVRQLQSKWCHTGSVCFMEVDPSHPPRICQWVEANPELGVVFEDSYQDMFGKDRFVKLRVL